MLLTLPEVKQVPYAQDPSNTTCENCFRANPNELMNTFRLEIRQSFLAKAWNWLHVALASAGESVTG